MIPTLTGPPEPIERIFTAHPEWVGKVIADLNFELPALAHGSRGRGSAAVMNMQPSIWNNILDGSTTVTDERRIRRMTTVAAPIETWSDDFSMAIAGIPSMVNDFTGGSFMETHYHSQFDNDEYYDPGRSTGCTP